MAAAVATVAAPAVAKRPYLARGSRSSFSDSFLDSLNSSAANSEFNSGTDAKLSEAVMSSEAA